MNADRYLKALDREFQKSKELQIGSRSGKLAGRNFRTGIDRARAIFEQMLDEDDKNKKPTLQDDLEGRN